MASYHTLEVDGKRNVDAAWYYPQPSRAADKIRGRVSFWRGVKVVPTESEQAAAGRRGLLARPLRAA